MTTNAQDFDRVMRATGAQHVSHVVTVTTPVSIILTGPRAGELHMLLADEPHASHIALGRAHVDIQRLILPTLQAPEGRKLHPFTDARLLELVGSAPSSGFMHTYRDFVPITP